MRIASLVSVSLPLALVAAVAPSALAVVTPEVMPTIVSPVTITSVVEAVAVIGGAMLTAWFGIMIGFKLIKRLAKKTSSSV